VAHSALDLRGEDTPETEAWGHIVDVLQKHGPTVLSALGVRIPAPGFSRLPECVHTEALQLLRARGLECLTAVYLSFGHRNFVWLNDRPESNNSSIYINAVVNKWFVSDICNASGVISDIEARSESGGILRVSADRFVVAAGAIESARILLEIADAAGNRCFPSSVQIGCGLSDHLSWPVARVHSEDRALAANLFGPVFRHGLMRQWHFIENSVDPVVPRHFAHFIFQLTSPGFNLAKEILLAFQTGTAPNVKISELADGFGGLVALAYKRVVRRRLFVPRSSEVLFQLDVEQANDPANRVSLSDTLDRWGRRIAVVQWNVKERDYRNVETMSRRIISRWPAPSEGFPRLLPIEHDDAISKPYDAYHPVRTCRMGSDSAAPVDFQLRVRGTENLYVLTTGVLPSAGTANPTFTMLCLGNMLSDHLYSLSRARRVSTV
jgi:choline dehydrogenase-like flavoprotein